MNLTTGIVGLPNAGKTTLFNALTSASAEASSYPFCTIDPNVGVVEVPDGRLRILDELLNPASCTPTSIRFTDIAGLVRGASKGEGRGNQFLADVRDTDALVHVVRCFEDPTVSHVEEVLNPVRDVDTIESELMLADLQSVEEAMPHLERVVATDPRSPRRSELEALRKIVSGLLEGVSVHASGEVTPGDLRAVRSYNLLSAKPVLYVANVGETPDQEDPGLDQLRGRVGEDRVLPVCAQLEAEVAQLEEGEEKGELLAELGLESSGIDRLVRAAYRLLRLIAFYTVANEKLQAWPLPSGSTASAAAGRIHSDMEEGFIRAEVTTVEDLAAAGGELQRLRQQGKLRTEGRGYVVRDGDVVQFLFRG